MNFGTVSLAAPQASSRVSRYSRTDRRVLATASQSTSSDPAEERCFLASAAIRLASTAKAVPSTSPSAMQSDHGLKQLAQQIAIAEVAMPILGEGRVGRHLPIEAEPAEP